MSVKCGKATANDDAKQTPRSEGAHVGLSLEATNVIVDYGLVVSLVLGGCCTNAWSLETLLKQGSGFGSALTFSQMSFTAFQALPSFITFQSASHNTTWLPRLKPRAVPLSTWLVQVLLLVSITLLNNWAFAFHVPLAIQIVVRSSGLAISMVFGYFFMYKTYTISQIFAVLLVTAGVIVATMSGPSSSSPSPGLSELREYSIGITMLVFASMMMGYYGTLQERTYIKYGPHWREGVFYTNLLSLPTFAFLKSDIQRGLLPLTQSSSGTIAGIPISYFVLTLNLVSQVLCTSSVNRLSSSVSSVTINLVLTARKALSLCISVWWFGDGWNMELGAGASMVFLGTIIYTLTGSMNKVKVQ